MSPTRGLGWVRRVGVGSTNPAKLAAVRSALRPYAPQALVSGLAAGSGVAEQPLGFEEITRGAGNRARAALAAGAELGVGIEDGLVPVASAAAAVTSQEARHPSPDVPRPGAVVNAYWNLGCAVVTDGTRTGVGFTSGFAYPSGAVDPAVAERAPIGDLFDRLWQARRDGEADAPSGRGIGNIGKLTGGVLTRQEYGRHAVLCALVRFLHPDLYGDDEVAA